MNLNELLDYEKITVQCHDNPDADAIASGYALYKFFLSHDIDVTFIYSGTSVIQKSNLLLMLKELNIPIVYHAPDKSKIDGLLITVDCCYGEGNVSYFEAENIIVIDHHQVTAPNEMSEVNPMLGSCSTLVWQLLSDAGFEITTDKALCTALYYGLMTDTGGFAEIQHPLDRDMHDALIIDKTLITLFVNSNISIEDMVVAGKAMMNYKFFEEHKCSMIRAEACDPNILGLISDLTLQVDKFDVCVVFSELPGGFKLSVRSCIKTMRANELAAFLTEGIGSGGGHTDKAGGFISKQKLKAINPDITIEDYLENRINYYYSLCVIYDVRTYKPDTTGMKPFVKMRMKLGYVDPSEFLPLGAHVTVRTLEGDLDLDIDGTFNIMIGLKGEVYPIKKQKFAASYEVVDEPYEIVTEYIPTLNCHSNGVIYKLSKYAHTCWAQGGSRILARELTNIAKIFTAWDPDNYYLGKPGDYLACRYDDHQDIYILEHSIFLKSYAPVNED